MLEIKISTWQYNALCRQHSSNLFFPPATFEKKEDREKREAKAKAVCNGSLPNKQTNERKRGR